MKAKARGVGLRLTLVIVWIGMTLSACTSLGTRPDREQESAASTSQGTPENEADFALQRAYREYLAWVEVELVPRVESEVKQMMRLGWVRSLDDIDLWHLHIGYSGDLFPEESEHVSIETLRSVHETAPYHLLYHSMERPHELRRRWMNRLAESKHDELRRWISEIEEHEFDYHEFFFSSGRYTRPPALRPASLARYAELWAAEDRPQSPHEIERLREYRNRVVFIVGSTQPGYFRASRELLQNSSIVSHTIESDAPPGKKQQLRPVNHRYPPGYRYPVMIVFAPTAEGSPFFGVSHIIRGEELVFGVRVFATID